MKKWFKTYLPFSRATVQAHILAYPFETFMYFFGMTIGIFVVYYIWKIIYATGGYHLLEGFTFQEMIVYVVLSFAAMQVTDNGTVWIIADEIKSGNIIMNLIKPINYHMRVFAEVGGITGFLTMVMILPVLVITLLVVKIGTPMTMLFFIVSLFFGVVISFLFDFIFGMLAFYVKNL